MTTPFESFVFSKLCTLGFQNTDNRTFFRKGKSHLSDIESILLFIDTKQEFTEINLSELFFKKHNELKLDPNRIAMLNTHLRIMEKENKAPLFTIQDNKLYLMRAFKDFVEECKKEFESHTKLTEEEEEVEETTNNIYITKDLDYNDFKRKFEQLYCKDAKQKFSPNMFIVKDDINFNTTKYIEQLTSEKSIPRKIVVKIINRMPLTVERHLKYEYKLHKFGIVTSDFDLEIDRITLFDSDKVRRLDNKKSGDPIFQSFKSSEIFKHPVVSINTYIHTIKLLQENNEFSHELILESFQNDLSPGMYEIIGYARTGEVTDITYFEGYHFKKIDDVTLDNVVFSPNKHAFFQLYNLFISHINDRGYQIQKRKSDGIIWMEVLLTLVQFSGYDKERKCHSLYAGFQDVGKTYITQLFSKIKFTQEKTISAQNFSIAGLFGGSNRDIILPNKKLVGQAVPGDFEGEQVIFEEIGRALINKNSDFNMILEDLKLGLFSNTINKSKVGAKPCPRNAYAKFIMNYSSEWIAHLRLKLLEIIEQKVIEINRERKNIHQTTSITQLQSKVNNPFVRLRVVKSIAENIDIFTPLDILEKMEFMKNFKELDCTTEEANLVVESVVELYKVYKNNSTDIKTSLPYAFRKRLLFSLFGVVKETNDDFSELNLNTKEKGELYIPTLRNFICRNVSGKEHLVKDKQLFARVTKILYEKLSEKYKDITDAVGSNTLTEMMFIIIKTLMLFNNEFDKPSLETTKLVEKWVYLQCTSVESKVIANYELLEKRISYLITEEYYNTVQW